MESHENGDITSPSHSPKAHENAVHNLRNLSTPQSAQGTEHFSPVEQGLQSPSPWINFDPQAAFQRWSQQPQLPGSQVSPRALWRTSFSASNTPQMDRTSYDPTPLNQIQYQTNSYNRSTFISQYTNDDDAIPQKKTNKANGNDDCKHCNCKKTKCLKKYCECFSSGYYCDKNCSCQECYNTPDYEDTVQESRENIEQRNPLAFTSKLGDSIVSNISSLKYIRGCNCKKTMCQKKYCDCFQSKVGCTNVCRCEGCENVHGRKRDYSKTKEMLSKRFINHISGITYDETLQKTGIQDYLPQTVQPHCNLSSLTSPPQFSYLQSAASSPDFCSPNGNPPQYYQDFENSQILSNSRNHCPGQNIPRRLNSKNADTSESSVPNNGIHNYFDPDIVSSYQASPTTPSNYLPISESQHFGNDYNENYVFDANTPPNDVETVTFSAHGQLSNLSRNLRGARNALLLPPLPPAVDRNESNNSAENDDFEDSKV